MAPKNKYDVFICFRGEDTRCNFTSHLHKALSNNSLQVYMDERLERGDEISSALLKAIEDSKLSVIVFSENYASSRWCLDELVHILRCKERDEQIVVPIFYHVSPCDVRKQLGNFGVVFGELEKRFKNNSDRLTQWRTALTSAANLSGWDAPTTRCESELIEKIVKDILKKLNFIMSPSNSDDLNGLVGIKRRVEYLESLLLLDANKIVGIWGMGGIGKTTLASVLFNRFSGGFEGQCFLENVREEWQKHNMLKLRKKLYAELLKEKGEDVVNIFAKERLCRTKVLIVLDDLDDVEQFEYLVGDRDWLSHGSRVIITTRDKQMLKNIGVDWVYMAEQLDEDEALQLFTSNAFKRDVPPSSYMELSKAVMNYASGIPLALKVLGSHLYSKSKEEWNSALKKLKVYPNKKIQNTLRISYDGLDDKEKDVFLDIACFFKGKFKKFVARLLDDDCMFADVVRVLVDKSIIIVTPYEKIWMHDLMQEMGLEIVRQDCMKEPGRRSRLWTSDDICHVLQNNTGSSKVEGIFLNMCEIRGKNMMKLKSTVFRKMYNLRLLEISRDFEQMEMCKLQLPQGLDALPNSLRYLKWLHYPLKSLPSTFMAQHLVELNMPFSQLEKLGDELQDLENLKVVDLSYSQKLTHIPDFSRANLKALKLHGCSNLVEVPSLRFERVHDTCVKKVVRRIPFSYPDRTTPVMSDSRSWLWFFPHVIDYSVSMFGCSNLKVLSHISGNIQYICLRSTAVEELHPSIWSLQNLSILDLSYCKSLKNLPKIMIQLKSLDHLDLEGCFSIDRFPELPKGLRFLKLTLTKIKQVSVSSFECLPYLEELHLNNCTRLESLPTSICKLKSLVVLNLSGCTELKSFPEIFEPMECLKDLSLGGTGIIKLHSSIEKLIGLRWLFLKDCKNLEFVPNNIFNMSGLELLSLSKCSKLESLPAVPVGFHFKIEIDLSHNSLLKLSDWICGLSSTPMLDSCGSMSDMRPVSIEPLSNMIFFMLDKGDTEKVVDVPSFTDCFISCRCKLSTYVKMPNIFCGCSRWDTEEYYKLVFKFLLFVMKEAIYLALTGGESIEETIWPKFHLCCPGNKIIGWFSEQTEGSSININLFSDWHGADFLGFAFCIVVEFEHYGFDLNSLNCRCEYVFKIGNGESHRWSWNSQRLEKAKGGEIEIKFLSSDHMFLGYIDEDYSDCVDAIEVSFDFYLEQNDWEELFNVGKYRVKECGIRMLYLHHAVELGLIDIEDGEEELDEIHYQVEPRGTGSSTTLIFHKQTIHVTAGKSEYQLSLPQDLGV
ncbi:disease resistance protein RPV1-like [Humulus lupulus]|uniref:disease resistance protein RPV1-like n=1 Tax=Humulus lupulus TaxID=3486 RepID=UPI002B41058E|nr:disease resistance protein RPV1-like [Humulus lupulus]